MVRTSVYVPIPGEHMLPASENELAFSMVRLWENDARRAARNYAFDCCRKDDASGFRKWHSVEQIIEKMQAIRESQTRTVCGVQRRVPVDRSPRWFEAMARVVMPALQRLGIVAIRGAGLWPGPDR